MPANEKEEEGFFVIKTTAPEVEETSNLIKSVESKGKNGIYSVF